MIYFTFFYFSSTSRVLLLQFLLHVLLQFYFTFYSSSTSLSTSQFYLENGVYLRSLREIELSLGIPAEFL